MNSVQLEYLQFFLYNPTAAKCALGTALIVATLWAFVVKPLLQRYCGFSKSTEPLEVVGHALFTPPITPTNINNKNINTKNNINNNKNTGETTPRRRRSPSPRRSRSAVKAEANHISNMLNNAAKSGNTKTSPVRYATPGPSVTDEALATLFHTPQFVRWYELHRQALLQRVQVRSAQELWMSIATLVVLLFGMFLLPFFSFQNTDATLWLLLQERYYKSHAKSTDLKSNNNTKNTNSSSFSFSSSWSVLFPELCVYAEALLLLVAVLTLLTTAFMPAAAAQTATTTLLAFLVLFCEAAVVQRVAVGAGFAALLAVVAWRVRSVCEV